MAWSKNGSTTLGSAGTNIEVTGMTASKFNQFMIHVIGNSNINVFWRYNNDTGSKYCDRWNNNGGSDGTSLNQTANWGYISSGSAYDTFDILYVFSISGEEKLTLTSVVDTGVAGAGGVPNRVSVVEKYIPDPDAGITEIDVFETATGSFNTDSNVSALGTD